MYPNQKYIYIYLKKKKIPFAAAIFRPTCPWQQRDDEGECVS
jgi:hypothetical protein